MSSAAVAAVTAEQLAAKHPSALPTHHPAQTRQPACHPGAPDATGHAAQPAAGFVETLVRKAAASVLTQAKALSRLARTAD